MDKVLGVEIVETLLMGGVGGVAQVPLVEIRWIGMGVMGVAEKHHLLADRQLFMQVAVLVEALVQLGRRVRAAVELAQ